jgi:hypothetical protein
MAQLRIMPQKGVQQMGKKDYWRTTKKSLIFATDTNGNLKNNIEKAIFEPETSRIRSRATNYRPLLSIEFLECEEWP